MLVLSQWPLSTGLNWDEGKRNRRRRRRWEEVLGMRREAELKAAPQSSTLVPNSADHSSFPHLWIEK